MSVVAKRNNLRCGVGSGMRDEGRERGTVADAR